MGPVEQGEQVWKQFREVTCQSQRKLPFPVSRSFTLTWTGRKEKIIRQMIRNENKPWELIIVKIFILSLYCGPGSFQGLFNLIL